MDVSLDSAAGSPLDAGDTGDPGETDNRDTADATVDDALAGMDVSAQTLREVKFREKFRGYHPDDVDEFLEQVAEGITYLQGRLREAQQWTGDAGSDAPDGSVSSGGPIENNEALRRTLALAQRTAQLAVQEGRHEAERIQAEARTQAEAVVSRAEDAARRTVEETNARLREEVGQLEAARQRLRADVDDLERYLEEQRQQLHASLSDALTRVEQVLPPATRPAPEAEPADVPSVPWPEPVVRTALWEPPSTAAEAKPLAVDEPAGPAAGAPPTVAAEHDDDVGSHRAVADEGDEPVGSIWAAETDETGHDSWGAVRPDEPPLDDDEDDPFIAELRRAITDTSPLGPRDDLPHDAREGLEQPVEQEVPGGRRFRRKRR